MFKLVVLLSGRGSNFQAILRAIESGNLKAEISGVISDKAEAPGLEFARSRSIPTAIVKRRAKEISVEEFNRNLAAAVNSFKPDLSILAGFMRILSPEFIEALDGKLLNIHPSLLPSFKGLHTHERALEAGVKFAGCTVHVATAELDAGPILAQAVVPVLRKDTAESLAARVLEQEHKLYPQVIAAFAEGRLKIKQDTTGLRVEGQILAEPPPSVLNF